MLKKITGFLVLLAFFNSCSQSSSSIADKNEQKSNDLINETSPYLLQHAYNPVAWKAWNPETLELAKQQNKLLIISVGYSACHWCHVMEEESFENDSIAKLMNESFINIKVDREERPDVDQVYMSAVQLMTGSGGWPLNCIALPDGRPVFGGTYFTKTQWTKILKDMSSLYENNPEKVIEYAEKLTEGIKNSDLISVNKESIVFNKNKIELITKELKRSLDFQNGGQKGAPKFPNPTNLDFLLRYSFQMEDEDLKQFVLTTLTKMANGGLYDQITGGFSRYSVDKKWHVPHFEKMLYDNAQLVSLYSNAYLLTKRASFKNVIIETLDFIEKELMQSESIFYSSLDADSENSNGKLEEGAYYVWSKDELKEVLGGDYNMFRSYYNVNAIGKWEMGKYILYKTMSDKEFSESYGIAITDLQIKVSSWKNKLNQIRKERKRPRTDDKVLTSWNALMLKGYVDAYNATGEQLYLDRAIGNAHFIEKKQIKDDGSLYHSYKDGKSTIEGFSEDYAHTISAFIALYEATFNKKWLNNAKKLMGYALIHFLDEETGMFYFTNVNQTNLIARKTEVQDNVIPSSNSVLAESLFKLGHYYSNKTYSDMSEQMLSNMILNIEKAPTGYTNWLNLYLNYSNPYYEVAISGKNAHSIMKELSKFYLPNILISGADTDSNLPLLKNKFIKEETLIYVCINGTCKLPVRRTDKALEQISK